MLLHAEQKKLPAFAVAISIGCDCMPSHHIKAHKIPTVSTPFDNIITPTHSLINLVEYDFEGFLDPLVLHRLPTENQQNFIIERRYGTLHPHDFPFGHSLNDEAVQSKFTHKIDNFRDVLRSTEPVLFVRRHMGRSEAERFARLVKRFWPQLQWHLLVVNNHLENDWNVSWATNWFCHDSAYVYPGDSEGWAYGLSQFTFKNPRDSIMFPI